MTTTMAEIIHITLSLALGILGCWAVFYSEENH